MSTLVQILEQLKIAERNAHNQSIEEQAAVLLVSIIRSMDSDQQKRFLKALKEEQ